MIEGLFLALYIAAAGSMLYGAFRSLKKARTIEDVPTSKIRSAHQGYVELLGIAGEHEGKHNTAPLTGTRCLWYDYRIERYQGGRNSRWTTIEKGASEDFFALSDATGDCLIDPRHSDVLTSTRKRWTGYFRHPGRTQETSLLGRLARQRYRYTERRIQSDQPLYAIGWFQTLHAPSFEEQQKDAMAKLLAEWKRDYDKLLERFDHNRDGAIDQQEWQQARREAAKQARVQVGQNYSDQDAHVLSKPAAGQAFLLSTSDPEQLSARYRRKSLGWLAGAAAFAALSIWYGLYRL